MEPVEVKAESERIILVLGGRNCDWLPYLVLTKPRAWRRTGEGLRLPEDVKRRSGGATIYGYAGHAEMPPMPVVFAVGEYDVWPDVDARKADARKELLRPFPSS